MLKKILRNILSVVLFKISVVKFIILGDETQEIIRTSSENIDLFKYNV